MDNILRNDSNEILEYALDKVMPDEAVRAVLKGRNFGNGHIYLVGVGKAAWRMTAACVDVLKAAGVEYEKGIVLTKYGHVEGPLEKVTCLEAGHPVPDENSFKGTREILKMTETLTADDTVIFLLSGGGSAIFEDPIVNGSETVNVTNQLLAAGAEITEINIIRKRLSKVKGGRFAQHCAPAKVVSVILSDILGNPIDMIASGPTCEDTSTSEQAKDLNDKYSINLSSLAKAAIDVETPKFLTNVENHISGSVDELCIAAGKKAEELGYRVIYLTAALDCEAADAGKFFGAIAKTQSSLVKDKVAYIAGGETVVHLKGTGKGGRNQEMALTAALALEGLENVMFFSVGSDGTDGPTDAAGGIVDGETSQQLKNLGYDIEAELANNNSYELLKAVDGLIITGPTGTNVNDVSILLIDGRKEELSEADSMEKNPEKRQAAWSKNLLKRENKSGWKHK